MAGDFAPRQELGDTNLPEGAVHLREGVLESNPALKAFMVQKQSLTLLGLMNRSE